jgi:hypothetical protein
MRKFALTKGGRYFLEELPFTNYKGAVTNAIRLIQIIIYQLSIINCQLSAFGGYGDCLPWPEKSIKMKLIMQNEPNLGQSQIVYNPNKNNVLQRKIHNGHLVKTNPNKPNFDL